MLKVLDGEGLGYISNVIAALDYAVEHRAQFNIRVINLSVAAGVYESYASDPLTLAAKRAVEAGVVVVTAAGNLGRNAQGQIWRTGGQGPRFGDDGSAFDIGSRAVARAMKERDQHGKDSILGMKILEQLDYASWPELQERATLQPDSVFPSVFPIVAAAADAGDTAAREILAQAAGELSSLVNAVAEHSGQGRENIMIVKTGGTVGRCAFFDVQLDAALKRVLPQAQIGGLRMSPAEAAARAARY